MKHAWIAAGLAAALLVGTVPVQAEKTDEKLEISILNYNVAGLPKLFGNAAADVEANQRAIGQILAGSEYDIIAVQEDFGYHKALAAGLTGYPYTTNHSGGVPGGDGMNIWAKYPLYNETREAWEEAYGIIEDGADEMTPKGILYTVVDLGDGVYLDFYDIHADAYGDEGSAAARRAQYLQLAEMIEEKSEGRPVIVTGDLTYPSITGTAAVCGRISWSRWVCGMYGLNCTTTETIRISPHGQIPGKSGIPSKNSCTGAAAGWRSILCPSLTPISLGKTR